MGLAVFMALALVTPFAFMQIGSTAAVTASHAQHVRDGTVNVGESASHVTSQDCLLSCTFSAATDAEFALVLILEQRNPQNLALDRDIVTPFGPEIPERPPQSV